MTGFFIADSMEGSAIIGLLNESDRAAAIIACTLVEDRLEKKLKSVLRDSTVFKTLFGTGHPLHFFGARNQLAYLMHIYGNPFYTELETIGSIRNKFAHLIADKGRPVNNFKSPVIKDLCDRLKLLEPIQMAESKRHGELSLGRPPSWAKGSDPKDVLIDPKRKYLATCGLCSSALSGHLDAKVIKAIWADRYP
jgi:hypothetical protein